MLSTKLANFPKSFPQAFNGNSAATPPGSGGTNIKKELFPYAYYTYDRLNRSHIGNISDAVKFAKWNTAQKNIFIENCKMTNALIDEDHFDMLKYCEFYCKQDVNVLRIGFEAFHAATLKYPIKLDVFDFLTAPALANAYMMREVYIPNGNLYQLNGEIQRFIQKTIYGGRCMTAGNIRHKVSKKMADFDACSLYPSAMRRMFTVEGVPEYYKHEDVNAIYNKDNLPYLLLHAFDEDQLKPTADKFYSQFFVDIEITAIGIHRAFPLIVKRENGIQTNCNECVKMTVDMITLQDLIRFQDISFKMGDGYYMKGNRDHTIRNVIQDLFNLRATYKKNNNPTQEIIKLVMNSAYGKTIQKPIKTFKQFVDKEHFNWFAKDRYHQIVEFTEFVETGRYLFEMKKRKSNQYNNVVFGTTVLSMSKRIMNEVMCLAEDMGIEIYYQDTDSMHIEYDRVNDLDKEFRKLYGRPLIGENTMGCFHNDLDEIDNAYITYHISLGKKMYCDVLSNDAGEQALHYRLKGIPQDIIKRTADKLFNGDLVKLYEHIYAGNEVEFDMLDGRTSFVMTRSGRIEYLANQKRKVKATALI